MPGSEEIGYSEALVGIDGEWRGIEVRAMENEKRVIDFDAKEHSRDVLPGLSDEDKRTATSLRSDEQADTDSTVLTWTDGGDRSDE